MIMIAKYRENIWKYNGTKNNWYNTRDGPWK